MTSRRDTQGHALAVIGAAGLLASLWLPWYSFQLPQSAVDSVAQMAKQFGALGPLVTSGAQLVNQLGPFHVTAWQAFTTTPAVLLVVGIIAGGLAALALTDRAGNTSQLTMLAAGVGAVLIGYRIAVPPGQGSFVHPAWGIYLALVCALVMLGGGALAGSDSGEAAPAASETSASVYPHAPTGAAWPTSQAPGASSWSDPRAAGGASAGWPEPPGQSAPAAGWSTSGSVPPPTP